MTPTGRPYLRRVLVGTAAATAGNLWTIVLGVVTLPALLHGLGTSDFGVFALLQVWNGTTGYLSIASVGAGVAGLRVVAAHGAAGDDAGTARAFGSLLVVGAGIGVAGGLAFAVAGPALFDALLGSRPESFATTARWFGASLFAEQVALSIQYATEGLQQVALSRLADAIRRTLTLGAATVTALVSGRLEAAVAAGAIAALAWAAVVALVVATSAGGRRRPARPQRADVTHLLRSASEVAGLTGVGVVHRSMDRLLAAGLFGPASVGLVEIATQVQNAASAVLSSSSYVATASAPWLEASEATSQQRALLVRGTRLVMLATVPTVLGLALLAGPLLGVWLGEPGRGADSLVPIAVLYIGLAAPLQVASNMLLGTGRVRAIIRAALPSLVLNLVASVVLCRLIGLPGLFWGTVVGTAALAPLLFRAIQAMVPVPLGEFLRLTVVPVLVPSAALTAVLVAVVAAPLPEAATLVLGSLLGGAAYAAAALKSPAARRELAVLLGTLGRSHPSGDGDGG